MCVCVCVEEKVRFSLFLRAKCARLVCILQLVIDSPVNSKDILPYCLEKRSLQRREQRKIFDKLANRFNQFS